MRFQDIMQRLAVELSLDELLPNEQGACAIDVDGLQLSFYPDPDGGFTLLCPLAPLDLADLAAQEALLEANLFRDGVGACALAMDETGRVYLSQRFAQADGPVHTFFSALERFAAQADHWRRVLSSGGLAERPH